MKYIIELDEIPNTGLFKARGANTLVFDKKGIENILEPYKEEHEIDWYKVAVDTPILVKASEDKAWHKRYFAKHEDGKVYAWMGGCTSWSTPHDDDISAWSFAKLAEAGDSE